MATDTSAALAAQLAEDAAERFLRYVRFDTQSEEDSDTYPSTAKQLDLLRLLLDELRELGLADAAIDEHGYVTATIPATVEHEVPAIAFFAHVDTAREVIGRRRLAAAAPLRGRRDPARRLGPDRSVPRSRRSSPSTSATTLITTDGTTLLGADDKAGIAEIMAAAAYLLAHPEVPHGPVKVAFNPDEEIGRGVTHFPVDTLRRGRRVHGRRLDRRRDPVGDVLRRAGADADPRPRDPSRLGEGRARERDQARRGGRRAAARSDALSPETTEEREGYVHPVRRLRRLVRGRAALHRPRLRERPARRARRVPARARRRGRRDRPALLDRGRVAHPVPEHARHARRSTRRSSATSRRRFAASASSRGERRSAAAPTARR